MQIVSPKIRPRNHEEILKFPSYWRPVFSIPSLAF